MQHEEARKLVAIEMDYWRNFLLEKVKETRKRNYLREEELIVAATLATASALLQQR